MEKIRFSILLTLLLLVFQCRMVFAQPSFHFYTRNEYIGLYKEEAVKQMILHGIPASITMAQALLESNDGNSPLAKFANNHFGIKCHKEWVGMSYTYDDDAKNECFRKYYSPTESYEDHSLFLRSRKWYIPLFSLPMSDYKAWAYGLKKAGYATEPRYAEMLIEIIEKFELQKLDYLNYMPNQRFEVFNTSTPKPEAKSVAEVRVVLVYNGVKYIETREEESFEWIAHDLRIDKHKLLQYNDFKKDTLLPKGTIVYIQPKRDECLHEFYMFRKGDSMHSVAQRFGVKLKKLYYYNRMEEGLEPEEGQRIYLAYRKDF
jgi:hypothetical protein